MLELRGIIASLSTVTLWKHPSPVGDQSNIKKSQQRNERATKEDKGFKGESSAQSILNAQIKSFYFRFTT